MKQVDLSENYFKISSKTQWFGSRYGDEEGTYSRNIWELVFSGLGYEEEKRSGRYRVSYLSNWAHGAAIYQDVGYGRYNGQLG